MWTQVCPVTGHPEGDQNLCVLYQESAAAKIVLPRPPSRPSVSFRRIINEPLQRLRSLVREREVEIRVLVTLVSGTMVVLKIQVLRSGRTISRGARQ
jgi:hypothetical protein